MKKGRITHILQYFGFEENISSCINKIFENIDRMNIDYYNKLINGKKKIGTGNQVIG